MIALLAAAAMAQDYAFPSSPEDHAHFYPTAYRDHAGVDWACGDIRYAGHRGSDFGGGSFSGMDAGRDIAAAADGVVVARNDGEFDRCTTADCPGGGGFGNYVAVQHADGFTTWYAHLKQWSVAVELGQVVRCGHKLGEMGSSGHSTGPHLHFEVRGPDNVSVEPFDGDCAAPPTRWVVQGTYDGLPGLDCGLPPTCDPAQPIACGEVVSARNDGEGSQDLVARYGYTCGASPTIGPERSYAFTSAEAVQVTVRLDGLEADLDLFVTPGLRCDTSTCVGASRAGQANPDEVVFVAEAGAAYAITVDGFNDAVSPFTLALSCAPPPDPEPDTEADTEPDTEADTGDTAAPADTDTGEARGGCACDGGGGLAGPSGLPLPLLFLLRRRRPTPRSSPCA